MMKTIMKILSKCILCMLITACVWFFLTPYFRIDKNTDGDQFRNLPENSIDVLILGSSHAQYSMNPAVFYVETGVYSYVLGSGCQPMSMSYYMLQEALKTQIPEVVILDVFTMIPAQAVCYADEMFYLAIEQMTGLNRLRAADHIDNKEKIAHYKYDLLMNHGNWKRDDFLFENKDDKTLNETMGYVFAQPTVFEFAHLIPKERKNYEVALKQKDIDALIRIKNLCDENNIKLILMKAVADLDQDNYDALYSVWDLAEKYKIEYVDFISLAEEIGFTFGMNGDTWHNNSWGAEKTSRYFAHYLQEKKYVKNHRYNEILERQYQNLRNHTGRALMENNIDIYQLLQFSAKYDVSMIVKYSGGLSTTIYEDENQLLNEAGIQFDFIQNKQNNYFAVIENGVTLANSNYPLTAKINGKQIVIGFDQIDVGETSFSDLGELEILFCGNDFTWINEISIDYASRFFWKNDCDGWICEVK